GISCNVGQTIFPGQKLGRAARLPDGNYYVGFSLFHSDIYSKNQRYIVPEFYLKESNITQLDISGKYKSIHDEKIIIKELTRKERKSLKK
ncbi:MAG: hypothetical protein HQ541_12225, partial [Mariniphaga sp.]|nr:hypothetical protein [Mariniphaga sp.]